MFETGKILAVAAMMWAAASWVAPVWAAAPDLFLGQKLMAEATITPGDAGTQPGGAISQFTPAPMPDLDQTAPQAQADNKPHMSPKLFHRQQGYRGEGYVFGSTIQEEQDRRAQPAPGVNLVMPLE